MAVSKIPRSFLTKLQPCVTSNFDMSTSHSPKINFSGVFTPVATPFNEDESISFDKLSQNFAKWNSTKLKGYLVEGSSGEAVLMDEEERIQLVKKVRSLVPPEKLLLAGGGCEGTRNTVRTCQQMAEAGADAVMVVTPCYYKAALNDRSLICHYEAVADTSPVPVLLYCVPANTGVDLSVEAVRVLCQHPNIVGMKDSTGDITKLAALVAATKKEDFQMLAGSAGYFLASLHVGCIGAVCGLGNILPEPLCDLYEQFQAGQFSKNGPGDDILVLQQRLLAPNTAVTKSYGVAGLKLAMDLMGYFGGPLRKPLMPLLPEQAKLLKDVFVQSNFLSSN